MRQFKKYVAIMVLLVGVTSAKTAMAGTTVYIFMSETCPICQSATISLKNLYAEYHPKGIEFIGVFPNESMSNDNSVMQFGKKYNLEFPLKLDVGQQLVKQFSATVTPQVFVMKDEQEVLYNGRIDNGYERVGKKRQVTTEFYLKNALDDILANRAVAIKETAPVGCFIVKK